MSDLEHSKGVYERRDDVQILDVREPYEWEAGRIAGSLHLPLNDLMGGAGEDELGHDRPVVVVCRVGNRSELGARTVAFPAISTGVYGYPLELAAPIAVEAGRDAPASIEEVRFVLFDVPAHAAFQRALHAAAP